MTARALHLSLCEPYARTIKNGGRMNKKFLHRVVLVLTSTLTGAAAQGHILEEPECAFYTVEGTGVIEAIHDADVDDYNCGHDSVNVKVKFYPNDPSLDFEREIDVATMRFSGGMNPPRQWFVDNDLGVGSTIGAVKLLSRDLYPGIDHMNIQSCEPVVFVFPDLEAIDPTHYQCLAK